MAVRATQAVIAALTLNNVPHTLVSQLAVSVIITGVGVSATQVALEVISTESPHLFASQLDLAVLAGFSPHIFASQFVLEVLVWNYEVPMPPIYPTLAGLTFSVIKRPKWYTGIGSAASGREVRVAYAVNPLWEWDLTYSYLPDEPTASATTNSDLKQLLGFYLAASGAFGGFLFQDPDDNTVTGQTLGTTDGSTTIWTLVRTYGGSDGTGTEPIGYVNSGVTLHLYLAGTLVDPASYDVLTTTPVNQQIRFHTAPTTGQAITATFGFYYYCRFKEDHQEFEKFFDKLWSLATVTLMSLRG